MGNLDSGSVGSASHLGDSKVPTDSHFVYEYLSRRVPMPIICFMAVADSSPESGGVENAARKALDLLGEYIEPAIIAEEDVNSAHMEKLMRSSLKEINARLYEQYHQGQSGPGISLTVVLADRKRAYIGHVGTCRIYLFHNERLYDLTPTGELSSGGPPEDEPMQLFEVPGRPNAETAGSIGEGGSLLGDSGEVKVGYNEVELSVGDTVILASDGLWKYIEEEEIVESLLTAMNVQRSASQLVKQAFARDAGDNATMAVWQYAVPGEKPSGDIKEVRKRERKGKAAEILIVSLLALVLLGIFAVGFAFGWRITDTFRKPAKESSHTEETSAAESGSRAEETREEEAEEEEQQPEQEEQENGQAAPRTAVVDGQGVRMRATPDPRGDIVGLLRDGQEVTLYEEVMGADSKTWSRAVGVVRSSGEDIDGEGYIRNDFLEIPETAEPEASSPR